MQLWTFDGDWSDAAQAATQAGCFFGVAIGPESDEGRVLVAYADGCVVQVMQPA